jgi:hypothetical protein
MSQGIGWVEFANDHRRTEGRNRIERVRACWEKLVTKVTKKRECKVTQISVAMTVESRECHESVNENDNGDDWNKLALIPNSKQAK